MIIAFVLQACACCSCWRSASCPAPWFTLTLVLMYFTWGEIYSLFPSIVGDYFGTKAPPSNYGVLYTAKGVASIIGGGVAALLFEHFGTWSAGFYGSAVLALLAAGLIFGLRGTAAALSDAACAGDGQVAWWTRTRSRGQLPTRTHAPSRSRRLVERSRLQSRRRVRRRSRAGGQRRAAGVHGRPESRLRQQGRVAGDEARDARLGAHVRRHGAIRRRRARDAIRGLDDLAEDRAGGRIQDCAPVRDRAGVAATAPAPADVLAHVEWLAIGFEIIDCVYPDWKFQPADFVASFGLHAALVVGEPLEVEAGAIPELVDQLSRFTVRLSRDGEVVAEGSGRNSLRSPALCLAELQAAIARRPGVPPLAAGDLVSSGTLTDSQPIAAGQTWRVDVDGIDLQPLTVTLD